MAEPAEHEGRLPHTSTTVERTLADLRLGAVEMGGLVIDQVTCAVRALLERDGALAATVLSREPQVDDYERRLDEDSVTYIALQQPVANDLRLARAISRISIELERAGDEAKKIARFAQHVVAVGDDDPVRAVSVYLRHMANLSTAMLRQAVRAADESDAGLARAVLARDPELDTEFSTALRQLISYVMQDQHYLKAAIDTVFALKGLERIGDHAKNIAKQTLYLVEGERLRRKSAEEKRKERDAASGSHGAASTE